MRQLSISLAATLACILFACTLIGSAQASDAQDILATYQRFVSAQNDRDLTRAKAEFLDTPDFLWVSDGKSIWTREAVLERMSRFQQLEVWHADPLLGEARIVSLGPDVAYLHMPLDLTLGTKASPSITRFLVSIVFKRVASRWKIAALLTTLDTP